MSLLAHLFGKKLESADEAGLAQLQELSHKVGQALPESIRVAMRLIEKRSPELGALVDHGQPGHEAFARLVIKAINLKHGQGGVAARHLDFEALPPLVCFRVTDAPDWGAFASLARQSLAELVRLAGSRMQGEEVNALLALEAHLVFAAEPRTVAVFPGPGEFVMRRDWLVRLAAALAPALPIDQAPDYLTRLLRRRPDILEDADYLTAFGYPLTCYLLKED